MRNEKSRTRFSVGNGGNGGIGGGALVVVVVVVAFAAAAAAAAMVTMSTPPFSSVCFPRGIVGRKIGIRERRHASSSSPSPSPSSKTSLFLVSFSRASAYVPRFDSSLSMASSSSSTSSSSSSAEKGDADVSEEEAGGAEESKEEKEKGENEVDDDDQKVTATATFAAAAVSEDATMPTEEDCSPLRQTDPHMADLIELEEYRQRAGLELIASENFVSAAVREALGSCLTNKYSEGQVGKRYYGGNEYIDQIEQLCMDRALALYGLDPDVWGVNVQPYSGSPANFAAYTALLKPHDRIMGLDLPSGGHLTHGFQTTKRKVSATSVYFESMPYVVSDATGLVDYDDMERRVRMFQPKLLIAGASAYPREWNYERMRRIADTVGALLMVDMAHISGLVAAKVAQSPFDYADVVTTTTHKSLRGPRSGMIFGRKEYMEKIDSAVFPSLQGGPHNHQIGALAVALGEADTSDFRLYAESVVKNARALAHGLMKRGHVLATGGTDNHLLLWDVRPWGLTGSKVERILEVSSITANKNSIPGDTSAINPGGVRLGTPALTTRGLNEEDFDVVAEFLHRGCMLAMQAQEVAEAELKMKQDGGDETALKKKKVLLKDFDSVLTNDEEISKEIDRLKEAVEEFALRFDMPGRV